MHYLIQNNFDIHPTRGDLESPFFASSPKARDSKDLLIDKKESREIFKFKYSLITCEDIPIEKHKVFIIDNEYDVNFINYERLKEKYIKYFGKEPKELDALSINKGVYDLPLTDKQRQILLAVTRAFNVYSGGIVEPLEKKEDTLLLEYVNGELEGFLIYALKLDFKQYFKVLSMREEPQEEIRTVLTNIITKKFIDAGYVNPKLPNQYIPILAFKHMKNDNGDSMVLSFWQAYALFAHFDKKTKWNFVATDRQSGKTYLSAALAFIMLLRPAGNDVVYVVVDENAFEQPFNYFKRLGAEAEKFGVFKFQESKRKAYCPLTGNQIIFALASSKMGVRGKSGKTVIYDEAGYTKDKAFLDGLPLIVTNNADLRAFSTINREQRKDSTERFYKNLILAETQGGLELDVQGKPYLFPAQGIRVTVDDIERKSPVAIALSKEALKKYPERYYAELYATMPQSEASIMPDGFFISTLDVRPTDSHILGYDPAKKSDTGGVVLLNEKRGIFVEEARLTNMSYVEQIDFLRDLGKRYNIKDYVLDRTGVGEAIRELGEGLFTQSIIYTSGKEVTEKYIMGNKVFNVPKRFLVDNIIALAEKKELQSLMQLKLLAHEFSLFGLKKTASGYSKYEAVAGTDDLVNAAMLTAFIFGKKKKYEAFLQARHIQRAKTLDNEVDGGEGLLHFIMKNQRHGELKRRG